ncbi:hypothetical protein QFZ79_003558 [Arthrobacter sp. V4I6]|uniref:eCIS core domain-containing protein n=1 Tax=unclassified Arthrobacter TaxID=235627 RepID=UPI002788F61A|nr:MULTISPECIES: DUF4157 domain-containing protein [unclassified Arthrobacter]MDQ0821184.1 hypothetical protein [Arthrobacter sp. V1I7]MDQ0855447.1 hypothetical protein [Arthrobacter sp. V4I6]
MHSHDHDQSDVDGLRTKPVRTESTDPATLYRAAAAGRSDVVGSRGLLALQRAVGNSGVRGLAEEERSPVLDVVSSGGGQPLEEPVRADMEGRLGHSFSDVRVHTGEAAHNSASSVNAHAYTVGSNIVFQRDKYEPGSDGGRTMLAHELTHVVQQRSGPVDGTATGTGVRVSDPSDRFEREAAATAERAMSGPAAPAVAQRIEAGSAVVQRDADEDTAQGSFVAGAAVQREEEEQEETAQGTFVDGQAVQRDEAEEEEPG